MSFQCNYCGKFATLTSPQYSLQEHKIKMQNSEYGDLVASIRAIGCPNPECKKLHLNLELSSYKHERFMQSGPVYEGMEKVASWTLLPDSSAKPLPDYIPEEIRNSYKEACLIVENSPKASAAMSRRCLQGIVRDFWNIPSGKRGNLGAEISYIKDKIDPDTYDAIRAVREVGDIGAHMEKSVDTIVDVDPREARLLIELIETLIEEWYVARNKRTIRNLALKSLTEEKRELKKISKQQGASEG